MWLLGPALLRRRIVGREYAGKLFLRVPGLLKKSGFEFVDDGAFY